ncbi:MAG: CBS domain-containing protein, partial [Chloroflexota bacterium]|nr:CBS domain-containing protein [Chloroflexota bacterium]
DVKDLLSYPEKSAGGLMTPQFVAVTPDMTVGEAIEHMRHLDYHPDIVYYVYVVDSLDYDTPLLLGVASLRDMIMAGLTPRMEEVMTTDFHRVAPNTPTEEVAALVGEYNLLAVPVVEEGQILGIVTVDDVLELLLPADWRERLPRLFR